MNNLTISATQKRVITSPRRVVAIEVPPFAQNEVRKMRITVVTETGYPAEPTAPVGTITQARVALTNGYGMVYRSATISAIADNEFTAILNCASEQIDAILASARFAPTYLEIIATIDGSVTEILNRQVSVQASVIAVTPSDPGGGIQEITFNDSNSVTWS